ncbi:MAG TPA: cytochrome d ubiquinol oxidase subunit II [Stenomitos sp.]
METLWFVLVLAMLIMYVLLDGFDLGAGTIHLWAAKTDDERRTVLRAIGPVWDGNEVWLIAAGGTLFFAFPVLYAVSFSGFYLPLMIVLWLLMLRGVAIELRSHIPHPMWASFWDVVFFLGSSLLALFFGTALGNIMRGVPIGPNGYFFVALWTDFSPLSPRPGVLDWYTVLIGLLGVSTMVMHGANYLAVKTLGDLHGRSRRIARGAWGVTILLTALATLATFYVRPTLWSNFLAHPAGFLLPLVAIAGLVLMGMGSFRENDRWAFGGSCAYIAGMMTSAAFTAYPNVLLATDPARNLSVYAAATSHYGMSVGLVWWILGMVLAALYFITIYRMFRGKVSA